MNNNRYYYHLLGLKPKLYWTLILKTTIALWWTWHHSPDGTYISMVNRAYGTRFFHTAMVVLSVRDQDSKLLWCKVNFLRWHLPCCLFTNHLIWWIIVVYVLDNVRQPKKKIHFRKSFLCVDFRNFCFTCYAFISILRN